jgi:DNA-binding MarR family transcriptional regulator
MMEFELLRSFVAVAECGGFHRAAERLNLTQSTVSQQIKRLELETKRPLFRRTTRTVALTDDGEMRAACCNWKKRLASALHRRHFPAPCALEQSKKSLVVRCRRHSVGLQAHIRM